MIRRPPTRIELRLEDLQEYEGIKRELAAAKSAQAGADSMQETPVAKTKQMLAEERLGLVHKSTPSK